MNDKKILQEMQILELARRQFLMRGDSYNANRISKVFNQMGEGWHQKVSDSVAGCGKGLGEDTLKMITANLDTLEPFLQ